MFSLGWQGARSTPAAAGARSWGSLVHWQGHATRERPPVSSCSSPSGWGTSAGCVRFCSQLLRGGCPCGSLMRQRAPEPCCRCCPCPAPAGQAHQIPIMASGLFGQRALQAGRCQQQEHLSRAAAVPRVEHTRRQQAPADRKQQCYFSSHKGRGNLRAAALASQSAGMQPEPNTWGQGHARSMCFMRCTAD